MMGNNIENQRYILYSGKKIIFKNNVQDFTNNFENIVSILGSVN